MLAVQLKVGFRDMVRIGHVVFNCRPGKPMAAAHHP